MFFVPCIVIQLCNINKQKTQFLNKFFNLIFLVFYMFRTSYVHLQEDIIVHTALCGMFSVLKLQ